VAFRIRQFKKADFDTLWRIDQACFDSQMAYSRPEMAFYMRRAGAFTLVAEGRANAEADVPNDGGPNQGLSGRSAPGKDQPGKDDLVAPLSPAVLGFIVAEMRRQVGHIITIDVVAEARRLGVGSALLVAAENQLREGGAVTVALETAVNNAAAIRFYRGKGYFVEKTVRGYYSNQLDALVMGKSLAVSG
jgi:ribosomal protein S18 acetylase RimI-like enzyme